jgi:hypothetical protein
MRVQEFNSAGEKKERFKEMFSKFLPLCMEILKLDSLPNMKFHAHIRDDKQPTFGRFVNETQTLEVALANRHPNDILRTIAHELQHYKQGTEHRLRPDSGETGSPIENEAHAMAGIVMRHFNKRYPEYLSDRPIIAEAKKPLTYTEELTAKLNEHLVKKPVPKFTAVEWAIMEGGGSIEQQ